MRRWWAVAILCASSAGILTHSLLSQTLWSPKGEPAAYRAPHRPLTKIADLLAQHKGEEEWRQVIVDDEHLRSEYIQAKPGAGVKRALHPDTRVWWVIMDGQVRFDIEQAGQFTASKGSMVQVPMQTFFSWEVIGSKPALIFETNVAGAQTLYESQVMPPRLPGMDWAQVRFNNRKIGDYRHNNKPHITFDEVARDLDAGKLKGTIRIVQDDRGTANFIYGKKLPPIDDPLKGHFHPEGSEYWLIMKGQIRYAIERVGIVIGNEGDVVYVPRYTYHAPHWWGSDGPSCRLALNGFPDISHMFKAD
jgi:mannose-6-phosphate isomerase-like protein (cupin superfamily)